MLAYPSWVTDDSVETFYTFVRAADREEAVRYARVECLISNEWDGLESDVEAGDLLELLVRRGKHKGV